MQFVNMASWILLINVLRQRKAGGWKSSASLRRDARSLLTKRIPTASLIRLFRLELNRADVLQGVVQDPVA